MGFYQWKDVPNYEGIYKVSTLGEIKSLHKDEKVLNPYLNEFGYFVVNLFKNGKRKKFKIHQLVAITFLDHTPCGHKIVVDHKNDIKTDNRLENLQLISNRENCYKTKNEKHSSKLKGVSWNCSNKKWHSRIRIKNKRIHLGYFSDEKDAFEIYEIASKNIDLYEGDDTIFKKLLEEKKIKKQ
jgi:hypothetical protein